MAGVSGHMHTPERPEALEPLMFFLSALRPRRMMPLRLEVSSQVLSESTIRNGRSSRCQTVLLLRAQS